MRARPSLRKDRYERRRQSHSSFRKGQARPLADHLRPHGHIIVSLIVQILFLFAAFYKLEGFLPYLWGGNTLLSAAVVLFLFGNDDNPTIKLTWFFILAVLPVFGLIL